MRVNAEDNANLILMRGNATDYVNLKFFARKCTDVANLIIPWLGMYTRYVCLLKSLCPPISDHLERELGCPNSLDCTLKGIVHGEGHLFPTRNT
jgi:hypothetical protein